MKYTATRIISATTAALDFEDNTGTPVEVLLTWTPDEFLVEIIANESTLHVFSDLPVPACVESAIIVTIQCALIADTGADLVELVSYFLPRGVLKCTLAEGASLDVAEAVGKSRLALCGALRSQNPLLMATVLEIMHSLDAFILGLPNSSEQP